MSSMEHRRGSVESLARRDDGRVAPVDPTQPGELLRGAAVDAAKADDPGSGRSVTTVTLAAVVGGLTGTVMAIVAVLAMTTLRPPLDPRLPGLAQQVSGFQQSLYALETTVRAAEVDLVRALDADTGLAGRIAEQTKGFERAMTDIAEARRLLQVESGPGSVVFGVSVVQLADAVASGRPFESEWVNLYALTAGHAPLRDQLSRLMPLATAGVPTLANLQAELRATAATAGAPVIDSDNLYLYGLNLVQSGLGMPIGTTAELQVIGGLVTEADQHLHAGDLASALTTLAALTDGAARPFRAWVAKARLRAAADAVVAELTKVSTNGLRARAKASAG